MRDDAIARDCHPDGRAIRLCTKSLLTSRNFAIVALAAVLAIVLLVVAWQGG